MVYQIEFSKAALKEAKKLSTSISEEIVRYLEKKVAPLSNPRALGKPLTANKTGLWRYRVGKYRIICQIREEVLTVIVIKIGKRDKVYD